MKKDLKQAILNFPIEDYLRDRGASPTKGEVEWQLSCPGCGKAKLIVNAPKRAWHCWVCEKATHNGRGGLLDLIELLDRTPREQAVDLILDSYQDPNSLTAIDHHLDHTQPTRTYRPTVPIPPPPHWRQGSVDYAGIMPYCQSRGITYQDICTFQLGWCDIGRYAGRLVFPVYEGGLLVYWQARAMWEQAQHPGGRYVKCLNPPKLNEQAAGATDVLFNLDQAAQYPRVCITEGPIDAIHTGPDAVCTFGKRLSPTQITKLLQADVTAVDLMWDGPGPTEPHGAWPEMWQTAMELDGVFDTRMVFLPTGDPGDYPREFLTGLRAHHARQLHGNNKTTLMEI